MEALSATCSLVACPQGTQPTPEGGLTAASCSPKPGFDGHVHGALPAPGSVSSPPSAIISLACLQCAQLGDESAHLQGS